MEFVAHGLAIDEIERAASEGSDWEAIPSLAWEPEGKPVSTKSLEATPTSREAASVINIPESPSHTKSLFDVAQAIKENQTETSRAADKVLNLFFEGMDVGALEDYSGFGHREIPKKDVMPESGGRARA